MQNNDSPSSQPLYTIEAKVLPLPTARGPSGHLYLEVFDETGKSVTQVHGLATKKTGGIRPMSCAAMGDTIKAYVRFHNCTFTIGVPESPQAGHPHKGRILFQGAKDDVLRGVEALKARADEINKLDVRYRLLSTNSNAIFADMVDTLGHHLSLDKKALAEVRKLHIYFPGLRTNFNTEAQKERHQNNRKPKTPKVDT